MRFLDLILIIEIKTVKEKSESSHTGYPIWMSKSDEELISISPTIQILLGTRLKIGIYRNNLQITWLKKEKNAVKKLFCIIIKLHTIYIVDLY